MKIEKIFYLLGFLAILKGILVAFGIDLPRRDGTIIENPIKYSQENIAFGVLLILLTLLIKSIYSHKQKN